MQPFSCQHREQHISKIQTEFSHPWNVKICWKHSLLVIKYRYLFLGKVMYVRTWILYLILTGLRIRIHLIRIRIRIQHFRLNTDPDPDPTRIQGFWWPKIEKNLQLIKNYIFFWSKTTIYLSLGLHKERPSYKRSLQLSKGNNQHFRTWNF